MRVIAFKSIIREMWKKRKQVLICAIICALLGGALGCVLTRKASIGNEAAVEKYEQQLKRYEEDLAELDNAIQAAEDNLETAQKQYDDQKKYCDESIYMQLDSTGFWVGEVQYTLKCQGDLGVTRSALSYYINGAQMRELIGQNVAQIEESYLGEILYTAATGNVLTITVYHYDEEMARKLLDAVEAIMAKDIDTISATQGAYSLEMVSDAVSLKADSSILNTQNSSLNNLKNYTNALTDAKNNLSNKNQDKENLVQSAEFDEAYPYGTADWVKGIIKYIVLGILAGVLLQFAWYVLKGLYGRTLQSADYPEALGISVIGSVDGEGKFSPSVERSSLEIELLLKKDKLEKACFGLLTNATDEKKEELSTLINAYTEALSESGVQSYVGASELEDAEELRQISEAGNVILFFKTGDTTYEQLERYVRQCERYNIMILGAIVVQ